MIDLALFHSYPATQKVWGTEIQIVNNSLYCCKLMVLEPGYQCSLHRHFQKDETFIVLEGRLVLQYGPSLDWMHVEAKDPGDSFRLYPNTWHRFWTPSAAAPCIFLEVSTTHSDDDVERAQESGLILPL